MTAIVWANMLLAIPFLVTFIVVPLWWTFKRPPASPSHTEARAYLRTRTAFASALARRRAARTQAATSVRSHAA